MVSNEYKKIKSDILKKLWLPFIIIGSNELKPRFKNKILKVLTLTYDSNCSEIATLIDRNLTTNENIRIWTNDFMQHVRLTTVTKSKIISSLRYEDHIYRDDFPLGEDLPFDLVNLDYVSQNPTFRKGRIEKEINSIEFTIKKHTISSKGFMLIYTTILNSFEIDLNHLIQQSKQNIQTGWIGFTLSKYPTLISDESQKANCIEDLIKQIAKKYQFNTIIRKKSIKYGENKTIISIIGLLLK